MQERWCLFLNKGITWLCPPYISAVIPVRRPNNPIQFSSFSVTFLRSLIDGDASCVLSRVTSSSPGELEAWLPGCWSLLRGWCNLCFVNVLRETDIAYTLTSAHRITPEFKKISFFEKSQVFIFHEPKYIKHTKKYLYSLLLSVMSEGSGVLTESVKFNSVPTISSQILDL